MIVQFYTWCAVDVPFSVELLGEQVTVVLFSLGKTKAVLMCLNLKAYRALNAVLSALVCV